MKFFLIFGVKLGVSTLHRVHTPGNFESFLNQVIRSVVTYLNKAFQLGLPQDAMDLIVSSI